MYSVTELSVMISFDSEVKVDPPSDIIFVGDPLRDMNLIEHLRIERQERLDTIFICTALVVQQVYKHTHTFWSHLVPKV